jgi:hypothetical protein
MRHLSAIALVLLLIALPSCKFFKGRKLFGKKADTMVVWQARQDSIRVADSIRAVQDRIMAEENAKLEAERKAEEEKLAWEKRFRYNIIVGSFITPQYAINLADVYRKQGYDTRILKVEGSRFELVSAEVHDNFSKAVARLKQFQDTVELDAWLFIKK